ncbi:hypothetical protein [Planctomyces sp. SH-PL62]|uniref:hypothetical protein n=1 Tax=Planctomyces sp. SH-PL62 TaxID=1636152 RepID=UPI000837D222|nr:hypothetical protein [Planctomyces sp. SH-PL62]
MDTEERIDWEENRKANQLCQEIRLATRLRQCFRAVEARDSLAVQDEIPLVIQQLYLFLDHLLGPDDSWESRGRWFDDMIQVEYQLLPGRFVISGGLVWGLLSDPGPQWSEPFYADVTIDAKRSETDSYLIRFGRLDDGDESGRLQLGFHASPGGPSDSVADLWEGKADWRYEFRKAALDGSKEQPG